MTSENNLYGKTKSELSTEKTLICRDIVREIMSFGVDQNQILKIIDLLSLELEDRVIMLRVRRALSNSENAEESIVEYESPKIIT